MKIRYFFKGLGTGILIATTILYFAYKNDISDADIILKAKKLGMVFAEDISGSALSIDEHNEQKVSKTFSPSITKKPSLSKQPEVTEVAAGEVTESGTDNQEVTQGNQEVTPEPEITVMPEPEVTEVPEITQEPEVSQQPEMTEVPQKEATDVPEDEIISFSINRGDWSRVVSERLESLGVVDDAKKFDKYLVDKGYAVRIRVGAFKVKKGASYEEIEQMITKK